MTEAAKEEPRGSMSKNEALSGGDLTRTAARWFMGARGGLEVTRADMQNARCLLGDLLSAVAADLEAQAEPHWDAWMKSEGLAAHRHAQTWTTYRAAAERVRGLIGKDKTNE